VGGDGLILEMDREHGNCSGTEKSQVENIRHLRARWRVCLLLSWLTVPEDIGKTKNALEEH